MLSTSRYMHTTTRKPAPAKTRPAVRMLQSGHSKTNGSIGIHKSVSMARIAATMRTREATMTARRRCTSGE